MTRAPLMLIFWIGDAHHQKIDQGINSGNTQVGSHIHKQHKKESIGQLSQD